MLGPPDPNPTMDLSELRIVRTVVVDSPHKLFVGGLPCEWTSDQVRRVAYRDVGHTHHPQVKELLLPYGPLRAFNLVMDRQTGNSKARVSMQSNHVHTDPQGYAFCEYMDNTLTEYVIQSLNGKPIGSRFLTVKRALGPTGGLSSPLPTTSPTTQSLPTSPLLLPRQ